MNITNINRLIEVIQKNSERLRMQNYVSIYGLGARVVSSEVLAKQREENYCGTSGCIAGWSTVLAERPDTRTILAQLDYDGYEQISNEFLGIGRDFSDMLYHAVPNEPGRYPVTPEGLSTELEERIQFRIEDGVWELVRVTADEAIRCLEIMKCDGVVDWGRAIFEANGIELEYNNV